MQRRSLLLCQRVSHIHILYMSLQEQNNCFTGDGCLDGCSCFNAVAGVIFCHIVIVQTLHPFDWGRWEEILYRSDVWAQGWCPGVRTGINLLVALTANSSGCKIGDLAALFFCVTLMDCRRSVKPLQTRWITQSCVCCMARMRSLFLRLLAPQADAAGSVKKPHRCAPAGSTRRGLLCLASVMCLKDSRHVSVITGLQ